MSSAIDRESYSDLANGLQDLALSQGEVPFLELLKANRGTFLPKWSKFLGKTQKEIDAEWNQRINEIDWNRDVRIPLLLDKSFTLERLTLVFQNFIMRLFHFKLRYSELDIINLLNIQIKRMIFSNLPNPMKQKIKNKPQGKPDLKKQIIGIDLFLIQAVMIKMEDNYPSENDLPDLAELGKELTVETTKTTIMKDKAITDIIGDQIEAVIQLQRLNDSSFFPREIRLDQESVGKFFELRKSLYKKEKDFDDAKTRFMNSILQILRNNVNALTNLIRVSKSDSARLAKKYVEELLKIRQNMLPSPVKRSLVGRA